jgi:hypothetical protein
MQLFSAHANLKKTLAVVLTALQVKVPVLVLQAMSLLKHLLRSGGKLC